MTEKQRKMTAHLLDIAGDTFSNRGCNDFDLREFGFTTEEMREMVAEMNAWNGTPEETAQISDQQLPWAMPDWLAIWWAKKKLLDE